MDSGATWFAVSAVAALWAILFLPPRIAAWRERQQFQALERRRRRQYAQIKRSGEGD